MSLWPGHLPNAPGTTQHRPMPPPPVPYGLGGGLGGFLLDPQWVLYYGHVFVRVREAFVIIAQK
jgi:hypothetical protein